MGLCLKVSNWSIEFSWVGFLNTPTSYSLKMEKESIVQKNNIVELKKPAEVKDMLTEVLRGG